MSLVQLRSRGILDGTISASDLATGVGGKVLQVVTFNYATEGNISASSYTDTNITQSITPSSTSSKILILANVNAYGYVNASTYRVFYLNLVRGSTEIADKQFHIGSTTNPTNSYVYGAMDGSIIYLDSPNTTSSTTYKIQAKVNNTANNCNVAINGDNAFTSGGSHLTLIEIAG